MELFVEYVLIVTGVVCVYLCLGGEGGGEAYKMTYLHIACLLGWWPRDLGDWQSDNKILEPDSIVLLVAHLTLDAGAQVRIPVRPRNFLPLPMIQERQLSVTTNVYAQMLVISNCLDTGFHSVVDRTSDCRGSRVRSQTRSHNFLDFS